MDLLFPDQGLLAQLESILNATVNYHLYQSTIGVGLDTTLADLTECAWAGYGGPIPLTYADFTVRGVTAHQGFATGAPISFGNTSGATQAAAGYYVTDVGNTVLLAFAAFDGGPVNIPDGTTLLVVPVWGDFSQLDS